MPHSALGMENVLVLRQTLYLISLMTIIRDKNTDHSAFVRTSNIIITMLVQEAMNHVSMKRCLIASGSGGTYLGLKPAQEICGVSILRAGESMEHGLNSAFHSVPIGKMLVQRNESTFESKLLFCKLPKGIETFLVFLMDPLLATGNSSILAIQVLLEKGVPEENIVFLNLISCSQGVENIRKQFPRLRLITAAIDPELNDQRYVVPGCGDFGDRYFGTY
ncbi:uracil phosphoribosyltransferase [Schizosaccharomyces cryophilus OY26]|uniref:uracil phosphoribosyltransferase n=1 Tax=Schizosaccharomyces cryophilus (strain OY26 / ATCC MYA-4695 / CBS 11777 / NBRC 106824 / NRRL Y48691) TaxID=653667 RepID=S9X525_SCHCR|nr:uracil phosphoribosyltransferase [Schizosaccharomyces cryophilus OY26]EPY52187.1 uracil phosphoribosyltransferase [Schizosaccharomyces cryophilus OY26]